MPVRICLTRGCNERTAGSYCDVHEQERLTRIRKRRAGDVRLTSRWRTVIRPAVLKRDGYRCTRCGSRDNLEAHHLNGIEDNRLTSLTTLCRSCNRGPVQREQNAERRSRPWPPR